MAETDPISLLASGVGPGHRASGPSPRPPSTKRATSKKGRRVPGRTGRGGAGWAWAPVRFAAIVLVHLRFDVFSPPTVYTWHGAIRAPPRTRGTGPALGLGPFTLTKKSLAPGPGPRGPTHPQLPIHPSGPLIRVRIWLESCSWESRGGRGPRPGGRARGPGPEPGARGRGPGPGPGPGARGPGPTPV